MVGGQFQQLLAQAQAVSKSEFRRREDDLHAAILAAQHRCREQGRAVIILVSGVEAAGKSEVVNRLSGWLDMRYVRTCSYWQTSSEERSRPHAWRFWRDLPARGEVAILFGSWYTAALMEPIETGVVGNDLSLDQAAQGDIRARAERCQRFEQTLVADGTVLIKLWFHIGAAEQQRRLQRKARNGHYINPYEASHADIYQPFVTIAEQVIAATDSTFARWNLIASEDPLARDLSAGEVILDYLEGRRGQSLPAPLPTAVTGEKRLAQVDLAARLGKDRYARRLEALQRDINERHWRCWARHCSTVVVFEGWDAAGKGGAIRRLTAALDARLYRVIPVGAPSDEERAHHYLWRFWRHVPRDGLITIYDRSWYGRVLVERVEGLAAEAEWRRAYAEINDFERLLSDHGIRLLKFWLHLSPEEQLRRFEARQKTPHKQHKLSQEDWRNRARRDDYERAVEEMLARTDHGHAPWHVLAGDDKRHARIEVLRRVNAVLGAHLNREAP